MAQSSQVTTSPFDKIANFRDVSTSLTSSHIKPNLFYRSANPDLLTIKDQSLLQNTYNIKTIVDLRTDSEHLARQKEKKNIPADVPVINEDLLTPAEPAAPYSAENPRASGASYKTIEINFNGSTYTSAMFSQLSYWNQAKLAFLYALGYRTEAIKIIGENVMAKRGLTGLAKDSLKHCRAEIKSVFDVLANEENWPVLVHCTQGKDRTGLVVLLVLGLLGVSKEDVSRDYLLSVPGLEEDREERVIAISSIGLPEEFAGCPEDWVEEVLGEIEREYGGVEKFLVDECGVGREQVAKVKENLERGA